MATKAKTKVTAKALATVRAARGRDNSPQWADVDKLTAEQYASHVRNALQYYNTEHSGKELKPKVIEWMKLNGYSAEEVAAFKKTKDNRCSLTVGAIAACLLKGMPDVRADFNKGRSQAEWLRGEIAKIVDSGKNDIDDPEDGTDAKPTVAAPSIQERVREAAMGMTGEIEDAIETFQLTPDAFDPKAFKVLNNLKGKGAKAAHARYIKEFYGRMLDELNELASGKADEQLREGYSHRSKKQIRKLMEFLNEIQTACNMLAEEAKVTRKPRAKKAVSKDKLVAKLKYMKTDTTLNIVSVNPGDIIGASELWVFNTKTRKLGKYIADDLHGPLGVKGTTITGYNPSTSIQKTIRKPAEKLKEFKAAGKVALRKFLDDINATDTKLSGRINEETLLLRVS